MRARIVLTDDQGRTFEGDVVLRPVAGGPKNARPEKQKALARPAPVADLDFRLPERAFVKRYARGLGGAQRFTLLLARMSKGKAGAEIAVKDVTRLWGRMTEPMGGAFNWAFPTRAQDNGWVESPKPGYYALLPGWLSILTG